MSEKTPTPHALADLAELSAKAMPGPWQEHKAKDYVTGPKREVGGFAQLHIPRMADRAFVIALVNAYRSGALVPAAAPDGWQSIESGGAFEDRPFRQLIVVEGTFLQLDTGVRFKRRHVGEATAHKYGPHGYQAHDIERLRADGNMDAVDRVTHWRPMLPPPPRPTEEK